MSKTLNIEIRPLSELFDDFRGAFKAAQQGRAFKRREGVYFTSLEAARNFLTRERLALLQAIRTQHPRSIYELAKAVDRNLKNVQQDVRLLERHGLVRFTEKRRGQKSKVKIPEAPFDQIALRITI
ncbi:MAG: ArsR family transcriptional regulator [Deltaproteobacteria bacterium]|nr:ArsR family transcriptional regulator [Deltaproteobacteria bacterium]